MCIQTVDLKRNYDNNTLEPILLNMVAPTMCCGATQFKSYKWFLDYLRGFGLFFDTKESIPENDLKDCAKNSDIDLIKIKEHLLYLRKKNNTKWPSKIVQGNHEIYTLDGEKKRRYDFEDVTDFISFSYKTKNFLKDVLAIYYYRHQVSNFLENISSYLEEDKSLILILNTDSQTLDPRFLPYVRYETENTQNGGYPWQEALLKLYILSKNPDDVKLVKQYV